MCLIHQLCERLLCKANRLNSIAMQCPTERVVRLLEEETNHSKVPKKINLTRQEIANLTALRVETVIRTIKKLEADKKLVIKAGKVYYPYQNK